MKTGHHCLFAGLQDGTGGITIFGLASGTGAGCMSWAIAGISLKNEYINGAQWVSTPAYLYHNKAHYLFFAIRNEPVNGVHSSVVISVEVSGSGATLHGFHKMDGAARTAPLVLNSAWGADTHALYVGTADGVLHAYKALALSEGARFKVSLGPEAGHKYDLLGGYLTASSGGTVMAVMGVKGTPYLFAAVRADLKPASPSKPAAASGGMSGGAVAGVVFAVFGSVGVAAAGLWYTRSAAWNPISKLRGGSTSFGSGSVGGMSLPGSASGFMAGVSKAYASARAGSSVERASLIKTSASYGGTSSAAGGSTADV
jgi:hypothetical protein